MDVFCFSTAFQLKQENRKMIYEDLFNVKIQMNFTSRAIGTHDSVIWCAEG